MNYTLMTAGRGTHLRIVSVALSLSIAVAWIGIAVSH
jgi:hypothetical protein